MRSYQGRVVNESSMMVMVLSVAVVVFFFKLIRKYISVVVMPVMAVVCTVAPPEACVAVAVASRLPVLYDTTLIWIAASSARVVMVMFSLLVDRRASDLPKSRKVLLVVVMAGRYDLQNSARLLVLA